jgi:hypothetical protein
VNFTVGLIAGLALMLPGLSALATWNFRASREGAVRPELPLTSVTALFLAIGVAAALHLVGFAVTHALWPAVEHLLAPSWWVRPPLADNPYDALWRLVRKDDASIQDLMVVAAAIAAECVLAAAIVASRGFYLLLDGADLRAQGWVHQNILRPKRNGYDPYAYVLTTPAQGDFGLGYEGMVADIRQGADGEVKTICLSQPQAFVYEIRNPRAAEGSPKINLARHRNANLKRHHKRWMGGVLALEASTIRNVVIHNVPSQFNRELVELLASLPEDDPANAIFADETQASSEPLPGEERDEGLIPERSRKSPRTAGLTSLQRMCDPVIRLALDNWPIIMAATIGVVVAFNWREPYRLPREWLFNMAPALWLSAVVALIWMGWLWIVRIADLFWMVLLRPRTTLPLLFIATLAILVVATAACGVDAAVALALYFAPFVTYPVANLAIWWLQEPADRAPIRGAWRATAFNVQQARTRAAFIPALTLKPDAAYDD